jgi:hypothetical protein
MPESVEFAYYKPVSSGRLCLALSAHRVDELSRHFRSKSGARGGVSDPTQRREENYFS